MPATLTLNIASIVISLTFGLLLGFTARSTLGNSPDFWTSLGAFGIHCRPDILDRQPRDHRTGQVDLGSGSRHPVVRNRFPEFHFRGLDRIWHVALPAVVLSLGGIAVQSRYIRASMLETLREDYIRYLPGKRA